MHLWVGGTEGVCGGRNVLLLTTTGNKLVIVLSPSQNYRKGQCITRLGGTKVPFIFLTSPWSSIFLPSLLTHPPHPYLLSVPRLI